MAVNWMYQVIRKPSELLFPVSGTLSKTPEETWRRYAPIFRRYSTPAITPEFLAALAQAEGAGNPAARTYWRWSPAQGPLAMYRPASSSVGMYQMTDGTFAQARRLCIVNHAVLREGAGDTPNPCRFNRLYVRVFPSHAVELTAAFLDDRVTGVLARHHLGGASAVQKQHLAAAIHLCGAAAGDSYAGHGFHFAAGLQCGDHDARAYLAHVDALKAEFTRLAARSRDGNGASPDAPQRKREL